MINTKTKKHSSGSYDITRKVLLAFFFKTLKEAEDFLEKYPERNEYSIDEFKFKSAHGFLVSRDYEDLIEEYPQ